MLRSYLKIKKKHHPRDGIVQPEDRQNFTKAQWLRPISNNTFVNPYLGSPICVSALVATNKMDAKLSYF